MTGHDFTLVLPEIVLAVSAMALLLIGAWTGGDRNARVINGVAAVILFLVGLWIALRGDMEGVSFASSYAADGFARYAKALLLFCSAVVVLLSESWFARRGIMKFEYPVLILLAAVGIRVMVVSGGMDALASGREAMSM